MLGAPTAHVARVVRLPAGAHGPLARESGAIVPFVHAVHSPSQNAREP